MHTVAFLFKTTVKYHVGNILIFLEGYDTKFSGQKKLD